MIDIRQSPHYANYMETKGWIVERINSANYFIRKLPLIGAVLKVQRPKEIDFEAITSIQKKHRVFRTIIEPNSAIDNKTLSENGYYLSKSPFLPTKTLQINLKSTKREIFANFKNDARTAIKRGGAILIKEYSTPNEIKVWRDSWKSSVNFQRFVPSVNDLVNLKKSFPQNNSIFLASHNINSSIIGGALFTRSFTDFSYYWYGFTNQEGRTSLSQYLLLYQGILWAKRCGCKIFDLEGIYDERFPNKSWLGFTHFKKSFGGSEILYPGAFVKNRLPF